VVHVGRQALYDRAGEVVGYELLFRGDAQAAEATERGVFATSQVLITAFTEVGLGALVSDGLCFVNLTREFLVGEMPLPFDHTQVVLEVLETVEIDDEVLAGVTSLVEQGYRIALDDFVLGLGHDRLLELASYVKIDLLDAWDQGTATGTAVAETVAETVAGIVAETVAACRRYPNIELVAERLETPAHAQLARDLGFDYFQGYALGRPQVVSAAALSPSRLRRVELLGLLVGPDLRVSRLIPLITSDPALSMRLLAAANADCLGLPVKVSSVHEAVLLLGVARLRDWATLMLVSDLDHGDEQQVSAAVTRARMCQNLARRLGVPAEAAFTAGLVSAVAELLDEPVADLAARLSLRADLTTALVNGTGPIGELLGLIAAYEASDLPALTTTMTAAPLLAGAEAHAYLDAVAWATQTIEATHTIDRAGPDRD
jgi:EAL and modified HD-GYP domain-containing signal transduction protein